MNTDASAIARAPAAASAAAPVFTVISTAIKAVEATALARVLHLYET